MTNKNFNYEAQKKFRQKHAYRYTAQATASTARTFLRKAPHSDLLLLQETLNSGVDAWEAHHISKLEKVAGRQTTLSKYRYQALAYVSDMMPADRLLFEKDLALALAGKRVPHHTKRKH
ncbi:MAG: hypothetical protein LKF36_01090 [Lactobacillus sp.]|jgi:hypothetical protein|nr:hypothetical protein [Lactobacillus sp.]